MSFDFGGSSNVVIHSCTNDLSVARDVYEQERSKKDAIPKLPDSEPDPYWRLLELVEIDMNKFNQRDNQYCFHWGVNVPGARSLLSNNCGVGGGGM